MLSHLNAVFGSFCTILAELSSCIVDRMAHKSCIYCLVLYRKSLPTSIQDK